MSYQATLKNAVKMTGIGLHSGKTVQLVLKPGRPGQGIRFFRSDLPNSAPVSAFYKNVVNTQLATTLGRGECTVSTVEHLMAALYGARIDNLDIEVDAPEIPIMDGSAAPFYEAIRETGIEIQLVKKPILVLRRKVEVKVGDKFAIAEPAARLEIQASIQWEHPAIGYQEYHYTQGKTPFSELCAARTFGFLHEVEALKRMGLARGGSLDNAIVLDHAAVLNPEGLRYSDEFVKHKVLDALGDFKLSGIELHAYFRLHRAGHDLHSQILTEIFSNPDHFEIIDDVQQDVPASLARPRPTVIAGSLAASLT